MVAENSAQFLEMLDLALAARSNREYLKTIDRVARSSTWESRARAVSEKLTAFTVTQQKC
jgi:hypothetical protein